MAAGIEAGVASKQQQIKTRDPAPGKIWIERLERPDRITREQLANWMSGIGFELIDTFDIFQGENNPKGTGMPERWFVVYGR